MRLRSVSIMAGVSVAAGRDGTIVQDCRHAHRLETPDAHPT